MTSLYNYLEIPNFSDSAIVTSAYYRLYGIYSPNNLDDMSFDVQRQIKTKQKEIKSAWSVLSDPKMKEKYDKNLKELFDIQKKEQDKTLELEMLMRRRESINRDITKREEELSSSKELVDLDIRIAKIKAVLGSMQWRKIDTFSKVNQSTKDFEKLGKRDSEYQSEKKNLHKIRSIYDALLSEIYEVERIIKKLEQEKNALREKIFAEDVWLSFFKETLQEIENDIKQLQKSNVRRYYDRNKQQKSKF